MNSTALPSRYFGTHRPAMLCSGQINVAVIRRRYRKRENSSVWKDRIMLHNLTLDGKLCLRDDKNAAFV